LWSVNTALRWRGCGKDLWALLDSRPDDGLVPEYAYIQDRWYQKYIIVSRERVLRNHWCAAPSTPSTLGYKC